MVLVDTRTRLLGNGRLKALIHQTVSDNKTETLKIGLDDKEKRNLVSGCGRKLIAKQTQRL